MPGFRSEPGLRSVVYEIRFTNDSLDEEPDADSLVQHDIW